jgi:hypothetical protein
MKAQKFILVLLALFLAGTGGAWAHGWRGHVGVYVGDPFWGPVWYPPPYYYPPQVVVVPAPQPPVYVEQQDAAPAAPAAGGQHYWYFCKSAKGYYPYIKECPDGWQKVLPQPGK